MIFRDAVRSLKNSMAKALFYWLTFVLTSMFVFLFFNISMSESFGFTWLENNNDTITTVTVFVIAVCLIIIFFANDFFIKNKSKELAVRLVCGATFMQLAEYLLIQTFILLLIAIPFGIVGAVLLVPVLNAIITGVLHSEFAIGIYPSAVGTTMVILGAVVFWTTYLNLSFAYRNSASSLMNERRLINPLSGASMIDNNIMLTEKEKEEKKRQMELRKQAGARTRKIVSLALFIIPLFMFYINRDMTLMFSLLGMLGFYLGVPNFAVPEINKLTMEKKTSDPQIVAVMGFFRTDLTILRANIILFLSCAVLLISILLGRNTTDLEMMLSLLSYVVMNVLLSMAIMFRFSTETYSRKKYFMTLDQIGYVKEEREKIIFREVSILYLTILAVALLYLGNIFISMILHGELSAGNAALLVLFMVLPMAIAYGVSILYYRRAVLHELA